MIAERVNDAVSSDMSAQEQTKSEPMKAGQPNFPAELTWDAQIRSAKRSQLRDVSVAEQPVPATERKGFFQDERPE